MTADEALAALWAGGVHCVEMEATADHVAIQIWPIYRKFDAKGCSAPTLEVALAYAVNELLPKMGLT